jgi:hypothetical protein
LVQKMDNSEFRIIGKIIDADLDAEGNLHVTLKNSNRFWAETAVKNLRRVRGRVLKIDAKEWELNPPKKEDPEDKNSLS